MQNTSNQSGRKAWLETVGIKRRTAYLKKKRRKLHNTTPTIIANNCVAGIVYHDLELPFNSPTINLQLFPKDFLRFVVRLEEYLQCELEEVFDERFHYPIGELRLDQESIRLYFVHYETFEEAKEKWIERCRRVDMNNLFIVFLHRGRVYPSTDIYQMFRQLPYKNKVMLTYPVGILDRDLVPYFSRRLKNIPGKMLEYPHLYSKKRYIDRFNFVKFFNRGQKTK